MIRWCRRARVGRRLLCWIVLPVLVVYLGGNIVLNSPWSKRRVAERLEARFGGEWKIDTLHCRPNGQLNVHDVHGVLDGGFVEVEDIFFTPNWSLLRQKRLGFHAIEVHNPIADLSEEWLRGVVGKVRQPEVEATPQVAQNDADSQPKTEPTEAAAGPTESSEVASKAAGQQTGAIGIRPSKGAEPKPQTEVEEHDAWLKVVGGALKVRDAQGQILVNVSGVKADIPYGGQDLEGELGCALLQAKGATVLQDASCIILKKGPNLFLKETDLHVLGLRLRPSFRVARGADQQYYFLADLRARPQSAQLVVKRNDFALVTAVENCQLRIRGGGRIDKPLTWLGEAAFQTGAIRAKESHRASEVFFDRAQMQARLQRGVLQVYGLEIAGEDITVMANGALLMDARGFGVVRLVTSPEKRDWIEKLCSGSQFFENQTQWIMHPLDTIDRYVLDVEFDGTVFQPMMRVEGRSPWHPVWPAFQRLADFVKQERGEEAASGQY